MASKNIPPLPSQTWIRIQPKSSRSRTLFSQDGSHLFILNRVRIPLLSSKFLSGNVCKRSFLLGKANLLIMHVVGYLILSLQVPWPGLFLYRANSVSIINNTFFTSYQRQGQLCTLPTFHPRKYQTRYGAVSFVSSNISCFYTTLTNLTGFIRQSTCECGQ